MKRSITLTFLWVFLLNTFAASFTPGNIVVTRVGPTVSTTGAKAYLDEYTTAGVLVQTIALPTDFYVPATADCGLTSISGDGQYLSLSGMPAAQLPTTAATAYARKILTVNYDGTIAAYTPTVTTPVTTSTISAQTNSGSNTFTLSVANASIAVGQYVFASSIPIGTTVTAISGTSLTLSANALANIASGQTLVFMASNTPIYANYKAPKGVFTTDGSNFWLGSEEKYIQYFNPNVNGGVPTNIVADDARYLTSVNGILHKAVRYSKEIATIGTSTNPFPTTAATAVNTSIINSSNDAHQIIAVDVDATVDGQDVMYVAENKGVAGSSWGINKYSKVGTTWTSNGGFGAFADAYMGVTAKVTAPGIVTIYTISRPNIASGYDGGHLTKYVDNAGYNVAPNLTETTVLQSFNQATSPKGGAWRSVNLVPENKNKSISSSTSISSLNITPSTNITVTSELTIDAPRTVNSVTVAAGGKLTMSGGALTATNGITLESDASGTATLKGSGSLTGTVTAKQYLGSARNWYVSSPIVNPATPGFTTTPDFTGIDYYYEYMEGGNNTNTAGQPGSPTLYWKGVNKGSEMAVGKGYITKSNAGTTIQFSGTPNNGDITTTFDLTRDDNKGKGFNLVGNPYPSYIDWSLVAADNPKLENTYYYRTKNTNTTTNTYTFVTWNGAGSGSYVVSNGSLPVNTAITSHIPPTQAFWVRVKTGTTKMYFNNGMREHRLDNNNLMKAPKQNTRTSVRLQLLNGGDSDELLIYQDTEASNGYDAYDSPKMMNNSAAVPDLYSKAGEEKLVINGLNSISDNLELPLGFTLKAAASGLKLKVSELSNLASGTKVYLLDKEQGSQTELLPSTEYTFNITASTINNESRFSLLFKASGVASGITNADKEHISVFVNAANQIAIIAAEKSNYAIYNAVGQLIENGIMNHKLHTINCKLNTGVYVVKVANNQITKVIIK